MDWQQVPVLVTGAAGFIGSHLVEDLVSQGARVRAFVRYTSRGDIGLLRYLTDDLFGKIEIVHGDLRDSSAVHRAMEGSEYVFHLGALIAIPYSYVNPREVVDTNVIGTLNVLEAARLTKPRRVIHTSTSEVYGTAKFVPITEEHPLQGQSPYSASKIGADKIAESYYRSFDTPVVTVRPFNTFGPRQSTRAVIPTIITQALTRREIRLGSLAPTRDFTFVADTARGFICAAEAEGVLGHEINLGTNNEISVGDLAQRIAGLLGEEISIVCEEERLRPGKSEVERLHADNSLAASLMGWTPQVSLDDGLQRTIDWIAEHRDLYRVAGYHV
ncbi:MAG TPA: GDP-mannose 4,6-dehydratase [Pyrinomonadaceae bacterium]|jgi:dTDP-glucose 4,6-dehydratase|nr:GDP-mannose 4,6-dehydratase [Pyrinomonadaceae bacterium]